MSYSQIQQQNVVAASAYNEYSFKVPSQAKQITFGARPNGSPPNIFWYTAPSGSSDPGSSSNLPAVYGTIPPNGSRTIFGVLGGQTVYFQLDQATQVIEVDYYGDV